MTSTRRKVYVAGHTGMVGSAILRHMSRDSGSRPITRSHDQLDLLNQAQVRDFFDLEKPDSVILAAAKVGGILANSKFPGEFIYENLMIQSNVIHQALVAGVRDLLFLGSSCIYPRQAHQPMDESALLGGKLEPTNEPYAIAKIAGIKLCESYNRQYGVSYRSVMPTNLYGPGDNFYSENSHVVPALMRRFHEAKVHGHKRVVVWGSGAPRREFLHVDDMAEACLFVMNLDQQTYESSTEKMATHINVGSGLDISIEELAHLIAEITGYSGNIVFDPSKPDGPPRKLLNVNCLDALGWRSKISLQDGLKRTYHWFEKNASQKGLGS